MSTVDFKRACQMAKASDVTYFIGHPGGLSACPNFTAVGFTDTPVTFVSDEINAALVGTTNDAIVVAFRGTLPLETDTWDDFWESIMDWLNDADAVPVKVSYADGLVHQGFADSLESLWNQLIPTVRNLAKSGKPVFVTGHSKGGALASLASIRLLREEKIKPAAVYTYGSARPGDDPFADSYDKLISENWRFENTDDIVPHLPPSLRMLEVLAEIDPRLQELEALEFKHVGNLEFFNWDGRLVQGDSFLLRTERFGHMMLRVATGEFDQIAQDHSIENQYVPKTCAAK